MLRAVLLLAAAGVSAAFAPAALPVNAGSRAAIARGPRMQQMSEAIPFLEKPKKLDSSMPGYAGFDPLGFSDYYDVKWLQEAEIKHGRICMLAVVGMFHPEIAKLPQFASFSTNPLEAFYQLSFAGWLQIFVFIGICESFSFEKVYYTDKAPGDLGFDPLRLGSNPASRKYYANAEVKNGRLAMIGFGGMLHHALLTKMGPFQQIAEQKFYPTGFAGGF
ncbi:light-harvesting Chl a protein 3 [Guillardia theta CCMP2712]|uniref:Light-harvesting Chl a protein 3 n=3 Tax=Guillardia theta TaxID=55529 RepID=L1ID46_GUITC|nr:light-harvesting Chl a protein 3 [Guillardia theta CCMP2712]EKX33755.1 light-harvesting Chl a protein 3 [Guillardia theta CCMP2712]CAM33406.1 light harvesting complex protein 3 precursor [Guillardia theta]|eukprot:XP_005820735.1 light-harvesting Chl a protein 3 [Guillardia theta CCMP2712]